MRQKLRYFVHIMITNGTIEKEMDRYGMHEMDRHWHWKNQIIWQSVEKNGGNSFMISSAVNVDFMKQDDDDDRFKCCMILEFLFDLISSAKWISWILIKWIDWILLNLNLNGSYLGLSKIPNCRPFWSLIRKTSTALPVVKNHNGMLQWNLLQCLL